MPNIKYAIFFFLLIFQAFRGLGQAPQIDTLQVMQALPTVLDSLSKLDSAGVLSQFQTAINDSLKNNTNAQHEETLMQNDSTFATKGSSDGDVETTIDYNARDSIFFDLKNQMMHMYGDAKVTYGNMTLKAERINMDWVDNSLEANYVEDSLGKKIGKPIFEEAGDVYETDDMKYNFKTRKAIINGIITEQDGAIMHGNRVKKNENDEMFIRGAKYTTCDMAEPHFHINSTKLKVIPNNKILSGPFNIHFGEIPTPIGFPFGLFPEPQSKSSGIIFPSYGEDFNRGFFLRQLGYYFYMGEYIDLKVTGDIFSKGSYGLTTLSRYRKRYKFSGNLNVRYNKTVNPQFESNAYSEDLWVNWSHSPESFGSSRFSASVSGGTSSFTANNNNLGQDYNANVNAQFSSNISYSKTFKGTPFNMAVNARHSQNIATGLVSLSLPEVSFNASRIQPFKNIGGLDDTFIGKLGFSYKMSAKNTVSNGAAPSAGSLNVINRNPLSDSIIDFNSDNLSLLLKSRGQQGVRHQIPISTSFSVLKNLTVTPSFNYSEVWYPNELRYSYDEEENGVRIDTLQGFSRAGWYSGGASVSTRLYGFYPIGGRKIQAVRHVITPSVGLSLSPDFGDPDRGYYQEVRINEEGDTRFFSKHERFAYGGAPLGESASVSLSLGNNLEMKVLSVTDSTEEYKKIKIFDNMSVSSSYNILADSFNLSNFNWNARTSLFNNKVSLALSGTMDPYVYVLDSIQEIASGSDRVHQRRLDQYTWNNGQGIGNLTRMSVAIGFNLSPKGGGKDDQRNQKDPNALPPGPGDFGYGAEDENFEAGNVNKFIATDPTQYVPFDVPWRLNVNYNLSYGKTGFEEETITQTLNFSGNVSITDKTSINFNSGYDMKKKEFVHTQLNVNRDLHCWNISFNWVPFGAFQSYFVTIAVNSAMLKDLKLDKRTQHSAQVF